MCESSGLLDLNQMQCKRGSARAANRWDRDGQGRRPQQDRTRRAHAMIAVSRCTDAGLQLFATNFYPEHGATKNPVRHCICLVCFDRLRA